MTADNEINEERLKANRKMDTKHPYTKTFSFVFLFFCRWSCVRLFAPLPGVLPPPSPCANALLWKLSTEKRKMQ